MTASYTPAQRAAVSRRYRAAEALERARQIAREAGRYGLATKQHSDAIAQAEQDYQLETEMTAWAVGPR